MPLLLRCPKRRTTKRMGTDALRNGDGGRLELPKITSSSITDSLGRRLADTYELRGVFKRR